MNIHYYKYFKVILILFLFPCVISAQAPTVKTSVDRTSILIGEQIQFKVKATYPNGVYRVHWLNVPDSISHFELVDKSKIDTTIENSNTTLEQTLTITSFDSGRWNTPALPVNFDPIKDDTTINILTDSIAVNVGYAPSDSTNELRDIKPIIEVTVPNYLWYYIGGGILLLLIIGFVLWKYFKNRKKNPPTIFTSKLSPFEEAMQSLEKLRQLNLQNPEEVKQYHAGLSQAFKWYISRKQRISIMNKTTGDVLILLSDNKLPQSSITDVATALRLGDAVKFAKYAPAVYESEDALVKLKDAISFIHNKIENPPTAQTNTKK